IAYPRVRFRRVQALPTRLPADPGPRQDRWHPRLRGGLGQDDSCIDGAVSTSLLEDEDRVEVHLLNRVEVGHERAESQDCVLKRRHVARRFAADTAKDWIGPNRFDHSHRVAIGQRRQAERDVLQVFDVDTAEAEDQEGTVHFVPRHPEDDLYSSLDEFLHEEAFDHQATISELTFHRRGRVHKFLLGSDAETDGLEFRLVDDLRTEGLEDDRIADFFGCPAELLDAAHDPRLRRSDAVGIQQGVRLLAPQPRATFANGAVEDRLRL